MRSLARFVLAAVPVAMLLGVLPLVNRVEPRVLGLPFLLVWLIFWVLMTPLFLLGAERLRQS